MTDRSLIKKLIGGVCKILMNCRLLPKVIILRMDGGICSQMHFYLIGKTLEKNGNRVLYDLDWYRECGKDLDGRLARNFDLQKLFPGLKLDNHIPRIIRKIYVSFFYYWNNYFESRSDSLKWTEFKAPMYLGGYFRDTESIYSDLFYSFFATDTSILDSTNRILLEEIASVEDSSCAVHIRRGDLAHFNEAYGEPADISYFKRAIATVRDYCNGRVKFFLFSDEPDWCEQHLVPFLKQDKYRLINYNGSEKGYLDLLLMSKCHHIITSQGSMGKYAALLREQRLQDGKVIMLRDRRDEWSSRFINTEEI